MPRQHRSQRDEREPSGDGLASLLREYVAAPRSTESPTFFGFVRQRNPHVFGHHDCRRTDYHDHVWRCGGLYVCRGCTAVIVASVVSGTVGLVTRWPVAVPTSTVAACFVGLLLLALVPLARPPRTILHDGRRVALGLLLGSAVAYVILCDDWVLRAVVVGVYIGVLVVRRVVRIGSADRAST